MKTAVILCACLLNICPLLVKAQNPSMMQDSTLNNLVHPKNYKACKIGSLGPVYKSGKGKRSMILIAGIGFGARELKSFARHYHKDYTVYIVTPAGFAGSAAPEMPDSSSRYSDLHWTYGISQGILKLIDSENLYKPVIVAHFITASQAALNLAANYPDKISKVIIIGGSPYRYYPNQKGNSWKDMDWEKEKLLTAEQRSKITETWIAPKWFKTVTKKTWDENMWTPDDYCMNSKKGKHLFKVSVKVPIQIMVRYMIEWGAYDPEQAYKNIGVPTLVLIPDFKGVLDGDLKDSVSCNRMAVKQYLKYYHQVSWEKGRNSGNSLLEFRTVPDTRLFMWYDNPDATFNEVYRFLAN